MVHFLFSGGFYLRVEIFRKEGLYMHLIVKGNQVNIPEPIMELGLIWEGDLSFF